LKKQSRTARSRATTTARPPSRGRAQAHPTGNEGPAIPRAAEAKPSAASPAARGTPEATASPPSRLPLAPSEWLTAARDALLDLLAAAREGARRPRERVLSRAEIRRQARHAFEQAAALLDMAAQALG